MEKAQKLLAQNGYPFLPFEVAPGMYRVFDMRTLACVSDVIGDCWQAWYYALCCLESQASLVA